MTHNFEVASLGGMSRFFLRNLLATLLLGFLPLTFGWAAEDSVSNYVLGPGDLIKITVLHEADLSLDVRLSDQGVISYPVIGQINAAGKTPHQLETMIRDALSGRYLMDPQVSVNLMAYRNFYVAGAVKSPGGYPYSPGITVQQAITLAGGLSEKSSDELLITREGADQGQSVPVRMTDKIRPGDHLEVKEAGDIIVEGQVASPGVYPYSRGMTVHRAIALAGGRTERASNTINVIHGNDPEHKSEEVEPFSPVRPGDVIQVEESFF